VSENEIFISLTQQQDAYRKKDVFCTQNRSPNQRKTENKNNLIDCMLNRLANRKETNNLKRHELMHCCKRQRTNPC